MPPFLGWGNLLDQELVTSSVLRLVKSCLHLSGRGLLVTTLFFGSTMVFILISMENLLFSMLSICLFFMVLRGPLPTAVMSVRCMSKSEGRAIYLLPREVRGGIFSMKSSGMEST